MRIIWSPLALQRTEEIAHYILEHNRSAAGKWMNTIFGKIKRLARYPTSGRMVPETMRSDIREIFHGSYRIIYRLRSNEVSILTIRHGKQRLPQRDLQSAGFLVLRGKLPLDIDLDKARGRD